MVGLFTAVSRVSLIKTRRGGPNQSAIISMIYLIGLKQGEHNLICEISHFTEHVAPRQRGANGGGLVISHHRFHQQVSKK